MIIYQSDFSQVSFNENYRCVIWHPLGAMTTEDWKASFDAGLEFYARNIYNYGQLQWLNDTKQMKAIGADNVDWLLKRCETITLVQGYPWPKLYYVYPDDFYGQLSVDMYIRQARLMNPKLSFAIYASREQALEAILQESEITKLY